MAKKAKKRKKFSLDALQDANKEILFDILEREGVETVTVTFDGSGDDGQIEDNDLPEKINGIVVKGSKINQGTMWDGKGKTTTRWKEDCTVEEILDSLCYEVLEAVHSGWEINDGAFGEFVFHVKDRTVSLDYNERIMESELYEYEF